MAGFDTTLKGKEGFINLAGWSLGLAALSWTARYMYKNSPAERSKGYPGRIRAGGVVLRRYIAAILICPTGIGSLL